MSEKKEFFEYTYSATEQAEVKRIRERYETPEKPRVDQDEKLERLRRLDAGVAQKSTAISLISGVIGALVFGAGMSLCLVWEMYLIGIVIGLVGALGIAAAYPLYKATTKRERKKIAPEIIRLTDELMK